MTVEIRNLFAKDIARRIDGVIKADDTASLGIELEEYVVTNEVSKRLEEFLHAYNDGRSGNGAWISGFFGSGKSHLLKMLALLLENTEVEGRAPLDYFRGKFGENRMVLADLERAVAIPSRSILFNIDQQADVASQNPTEALLGVFVKVFDEMQGYYGKLPHVANFERDLDRMGKCDRFRESFERLAGEPWREARRSPQLYDVEIAEAYAKATGRKVQENILDTYWDRRVLSIRDFAERVQAYIAERDADAPGFRLNFFVDEVGQYIADNTKLMTNLQTIAESLNTTCRGRAWVVVTAQQDMDVIIGEMNAQRGNDFSKIMGRFDVKLPLNAADVAEVIQRRLLAKKATVETDLGKIYDDQAESLRALFAFTDGTRQLKGYRDRAHFIASYPFHPYQYELFQQSIRALSEQNAFEGKYTSTGERSMLGTFQTVAKALMDAPLGRIASFDLMFLGISKTLKASAQHAIITADNQLDDEFARRVLKALFLVKYVDSFKSTLPNVAILLLDRIDGVDMAAHRRQVESALNLLERESYVQRNGEIYEFLTDEEKDIERKIKAVEFDSTDINDELAEMLFREIFPPRTIGHEASHQEFPFARRVHNTLKGKDHPLAINLITPYMMEEDRGAATLALRSQAEDELMILLPEEGKLVEELVMFLRTKRFLSRERSTEIAESTSSILKAKQEANDKRRVRIVTLLRGQVGMADMMVRGEILDIRSSDPKARIEQAFQVLVDRAFAHLGMLRRARYAMSDLERHLDMTDDGQLTEAEREILNRIGAHRQRAMRSTLATVVEEMGRKPYGWDSAATLCLVASLIGRGRLEARRGGDILDRAAVLRDFPNTRLHDGITLERQEAIDAAQVLVLKNFLQDGLGVAPMAHDGKGLAEEIAAALADLDRRVSDFLGQSGTYPFVAALQPFAGVVAEMKGKPVSWHVAELPARADDFADMREDIFDPIDAFFTGPQKAIFDAARDFLRDERQNLAFLEGAQVAKVEQALADPGLLSGSGMRDLKAGFEGIRDALRLLVSGERDRAVRAVEARRERLRAAEEYQQASEAARARVEELIEAQLAALPSMSDIPALRNFVTQFETVEYPGLMNVLIASAPAPDAPAGVEDMSGTPDGGPARPEGPPSDPQPVSLPISLVRVEFDRVTLRSEADVDAYLEKMRAALNEALREGKRITL